MMSTIQVRLQSAMSAHDMNETLARKSTPPIARKVNSLGKMEKGMVTGYSDSHSMILIKQCHPQPGSNLTKAPKQQSVATFQYHHTHQTVSTAGTLEDDVLDRTNAFDMVRDGKSFPVNDIQPNLPVAPSKSNVVEPIAFDAGLFRNGNMFSFVSHTWQENNALAFIPGMTTTRKNRIHGSLT